MSVELIDVTLRDGGYRTNFNFSNTALKEIINALNKPQIEYIEIGYRNGSFKPIKNIGPSGRCERDYLEKCKKLVDKTKLAVMVHPGNVKKDDFKELVDCGIDLCRICLSKGEYSNFYHAIDEAVKLGLDVSANITRVSNYSEKELDAIVFELQSHEVKMIYFADSNGSLLPSKVKTIYNKYTNTGLIPFGFHAHDNLGLAQVNAITALNQGAQYIDSSLAGIGKGIGNLKTELFLAYLFATGINNRYDFNDIVKVANLMHRVNNEKYITAEYLLMGVKNLSVDAVEAIDLKEQELCN